MAPRTYGKKKSSLFKALSSRRRRRSTAASPFDESHEDDNGESGLEPFPAFDENAGLSRPPHAGQPTTSPVVDADEIERKVSAMLAATQALKPKTPHPKGAAASKVSRMVPSVLAKMSNAWDRLSSRPATPESTEAAKIRKEAIRHNVDGPALRSTTHIPAPPAHISTETTALRRTEGTNLNKRKAQRIPGANMSGKLTSSARKSLKTDQAVDVSGGEPTALQPPSDLEVWRMFVEMGEAGDPARMAAHGSDCPFGSEAGFEQNLEDRILNTQPTGSSTPRPGSPCKSSNASDPKSAYPSEGESLASDVKVNLAKVAVKLGDDEARATIRQVDVKQSASVKGTALASGADRRAKSNVFDRINAIKGEERQKKHPSPSKQELENLELALQWYLPLKATKPDPHVD
ncbi:hypothetical protein JDV02_006744 [Purpureocillium takamizusanense]|uniref:Uncharacterized protein n=1 Tax=Purpureocillium takamizusanense TaxID=2060973 RepID=A0A9Q8VD16_9HYPO|nr:uncharacterized protein JDV02_006744 [Purpureocillium takamizusanense]UNI20676.1 hypothetical protein JDV02_006744 [Purpureocillium takamizusanense]